MAVEPHGSLSGRQRQSSFKNFYFRHSYLYSVMQSYALIVPKRFSDVERTDKNFELSSHALKHAPFTKRSRPSNTAATARLLHADNDAAGKVGTIKQLNICFHRTDWHKNLYHVECAGCKFYRYIAKRSVRKTDFHSPAIRLHQGYVVRVNQQTFLIGNRFHASSVLWIVSESLRVKRWTTETRLKKTTRNALPKKSRVLIFVADVQYLFDCNPWLIKFFHHFMRLIINGGLHSLFLYLIERHRWRSVFTWLRSFFDQTFFSHSIHFSTTCTSVTGGITINIR